MRIMVEDLHFTYPGDVLALDGVDLTIESGEAVAIVGENGAGKTTLAKHLNGLLTPSQGRVLIGDWDTADVSVARMAARVGYVFQNPDEQLFERSVMREVAFGPANIGLEGERLETCCRRALKQVGLLDALNQHPYDLHASERKLVAIAAALAMETPIVVLDEPTTGQDLAGLKLMGKLVESLLKEGRTVLAISHDLDFCAANFSRVIVMANACIQADDRPDVIFRDKELLARAGVDAPQLVRLARALGMDSIPLTVPAFVSAWLEEHDDHHTG
ncbi:MAG: ABC transporter ATP-binding protein [Anaerolineales bacterium]|nr:ABC transporter ATP-binding protein [Anaerolineales bacterium]